MRTCTELLRSSAQQKLSASAPFGPPTIAWVIFLGQTTKRGCYTRLPNFAEENGILPSAELQMVGGPIKQVCHIIQMKKMQITTLHEFTYASSTLVAQAKPFGK
jgi:hypothetical protein